MEETLEDHELSYGEWKLLCKLHSAPDHTSTPGELAAKLELSSGAMTNRLEATSARLEQIQGAVTEQLSNTEDADIAKTIIQFNSQSAAYQASLRAGASIVQSSLMDFLK